MYNPLRSPEPAPGTTAAVVSRGHDGCRGRVVFYRSPSHPEARMSWQKRLLLTCVVTAAVFSVAPVGSAGAQSAGDLLRHFLDEAPRRWDECHSFAERLQGRATGSTKRDGKMIAYGSGE